MKGSRLCLAIGLATFALCVAAALHGRACLTYAAEHRGDADEWVEGTTPAEPRVRSGCGWSEGEMLYVMALMYSSKVSWMEARGRQLTWLALLGSVAAAGLVIRRTWGVWPAAGAGIVAALYLIPMIPAFAHTQPESSLYSGFVLLALAAPSVLILRSLSSSSPPISS